MGVEIRGEVEVFRGVRALVRALLLPTLDFLAGPYLMSLFCFIRLAKELIQKLRQARDSTAIAINLKSKERNFSKRTS